MIRKSTLFPGLDLGDVSLLATIQGENLFGGVGGELRENIVMTEVI